MRMTFTLDEEVAKRARELGVNISEAALFGVITAVRNAMVRVDRAAYERQPEQPDPFWDEAEAF